MVSEEVREAVELVIQQVQILFVLLARPIVQRELLALVMVFLISWGAAALLRSLHNRRYAAAGRGPQSAKRHRFLISVSLIYAPIAALILLNITEWIFIQLGHPVGLLVEAKPILWAWLVYRALLAGLYHRYGTAMRPFHHWVLLPLFLWLVTATLFDNFVSLHMLADIPLFTAFGTTITVNSLASAILVIYWFIVAAWLINVSIRRVFASRPSVEPGVVESVVTISRYVVLAAGLMLALYFLGIDLSTLALIGGALSIGVGFGLQSIVASFISGLVLLFEQSLLPGDVIDIHNGIGTVEKVNIRSTTVRTNDNVEVIIPNDFFLTNEVTTFTKTDSRIRILLPFGVSYETSPHLVKDVAVLTAGGHPKVLADPAPQLFLSRLW